MGHAGACVARHGRGTGGRAEPESELVAIVSQPRKELDEIARELVARAVENDGNDNTTAQVIRVRSTEQVGMYRGRPYRLPA